jgi:hypothetical protein
MRTQPSGFSSGGEARPRRSPGVAHPRAGGTRRLGPLEPVAGPRGLSERCHVATQTPALSGSSVSASWAAPGRWLPRGRPPAETIVLDIPVPPFSWAEPRARVPARLRWMSSVSQDARRVPSIRCWSLGSLQTVAPAMVPSAKPTATMRASGTHEKIDGSLDDRRLSTAAVPPMAVSHDRDDCTDRQRSAWVAEQLRPMDPRMAPRGRDQRARAATASRAGVPDLEGDLR